ncbi:hypothetical protein BSR28_01320 [Boudabousia liubingyangii]|uniref:LacI family DNA-binding transcriptional regulator n=1 Tax=Boudabousia liubingyangii TaxID=1921764 RepID=UPI0009630795|nr:LacI family DNA-binding transcriptional regulator [Boudabousia liubingyangii]OKL48371.1 hypothetical protein BSR28_01320 [Boudabousia liubingyangii]
MLKDNLGVTMQMVADEAGVSRATVSRVFSNPEIVDKETASRIKAIAARLGYIRNEAATQLASRSSDLIGLLVRDVTNEAYARLYDNLIHSVLDEGYFINAMSVGSTRNKNVGTGQAAEMKRHENKRLARLMSLRPGGIFVSTGLIKPQDILPYASQIPVIVMPHPEPHPQLNAVGYDEESNARIVSQMIIDAGHKKVGVMTALRENSLTEYIRGEGVIKHLSEAGIEVFRRPLPPIGSDALDRFFLTVAEDVKNNRYTAMSFLNDHRAIKFIIWAQEHGIKVPEDIGVVGYDGLGQASKVVGLSTLRHPVDQVCEKGASEMLGMLKGEIRSNEGRKFLFAGEPITGRTLS